MLQKKIDYTKILFVFDLKLACTNKIMHDL